MEERGQQEGNKVRLRLREVSSWVGEGWKPFPTSRPWETWAWYGQHGMSPQLPAQREGQPGLFPPQESNFWYLPDNMPQTQRFGSGILNEIQSNRQKQLLSTLSPNLVVLSLSSKYSVEVSLMKKILFLPVWVSLFPIKALADLASFYGLLMTKGYHFV